MVVKGIMSVNVDISLEEAMKVVISSFGFADSHGNLDSDLIVLEQTDKRNPTGKLGLFREVDVSYHGTPDYIYKFVTDDAEVIRNFEYLEDLVEYSKRL